MEHVHGSSELHGVYRPKSIAIKVLDDFDHSRPEPLPRLAGGMRFGINTKSVFGELLPLRLQRWTAQEVLTVSSDKKISAA
jgi:hypothetical protein